MTKKIYKYTLQPTDVQDLRLPGGSKVLSVLNQRDQIVIYFLVTPTPTYPHQDWKITVKSTGESIVEEEDLSPDKFVGSVSLSGGNLIFHVFAELIPRT